ncbi:MAG: DUF4261 domain-containing protein [Filimonas sp.]|nr:DUF4261 domain-containing protein [Filimonas sp.]
MRIEEETNDELENFPEMLSAKLLFVGKPILDVKKILAELKNYFASVDNPDPCMFFFPDILVKLKDATIPAQCTLLLPDAGKEEIILPPEALQQNWHWPEATTIAASCNYEVVVTDLMTRMLDYKNRAHLFINFLTAVSKALKPQAIYIASAQKLISPLSLIERWDSDNKEILFALCNVRLFNITNSNEQLMDTVGLSNLGLCDFQLRFRNIRENNVAGLLWNYAYYLFRQGDIIYNENTIAGLNADSKLTCERQVSLVVPERVVINLQM